MLSFFSGVLALSRDECRIQPTNQLVCLMCSMEYKKALSLCIWTHSIRNLSEFPE